MKIPEFAEQPELDPWLWLQKWLIDAEEEGENEPTAMALSTLSKEGSPRTRFVLCKGVSEAGIRFFTNLNSAKGDEISRNPIASVAFHWPKLNRQVRAQGKLNRVSEDDANEYFHSRNRLSKIGAWASKQSQPLESRDALLKSVEEFSDKFKSDVPRPPIGLVFTSSPITGSSGRGTKADCMIDGPSIPKEKAGFLGGFFHESSSLDHRGIRRHRG